MNFKVRKAYFYALVTRFCYLCAGMLAVAIGHNDQLYGILYICFIMFFAVYFSDKEAEEKEKVTK
jgi:uncharacterized membrane protein YsdA (DUF1294 family)